ncbi:MAG: hypothetical protein EAX86_04850 [Candidatus Heimdallarchaeota archaeon]|nr:hypothetical protein [Candidatus Heimdallarchaeota archaeon]
MQSSNQVNQSLHDPDQHELNVQRKNGVHAPSFITEIYQHMYRMVNQNWLEHHDESEFWEEMLDRHTTSDYQIWEYHKTATGRLFKVIRENARTNLKSCYWNIETALVNGLTLDPDTLTIGFARRFAT